LLEVDDVDLAAGTEDVRAHLRVPVAGLVAEVDAGFQHLAHGDLGHCLNSDMESAPGKVVGDDPPAGGPWIPGLGLPAASASEPQVLGPRAPRRGLWQQVCIRRWRPSWAACAGWEARESPGIVAATAGYGQAAGGAMAGA